VEIASSSRKRVLGLGETLPPRSQGLWVECDPATGVGPVGRLRHPIAVRLRSVLPRVAFAVVSNWSLSTSRSIRSLKKLS